MKTALLTGWKAFARSLPEGATVLDLATGSGAVLDALHSGRADLFLTGVDNADIPSGASKHSILAGIDCAALPFGDGAFNAVTSQFGIEYCPPDALREAARVLAARGSIRLLIHAEGSKAVLHNRGRLAALRAMAEAGLFQMARQAVAGLRDPALLARLERARAAHRAQTVVMELPAALDQALRGPRPIDRIATLEAQARGEMARLAAMSDAARSRGQVDLMAAALQETGVSAKVEPLHVSGSGQLAWVIAGSKPA